LFLDEAVLVRYAPHWIVLISYLLVDQIVNFKQVPSSLFQLDLKRAPSIYDRSLKTGYLHAFQALLYAVVLRLFSAT